MVKNVLVFLSVVYAGAIASAAAPSCNAVFIDESRIIKDLALLRLDIDKSMVEDSVDVDLPLKILSDRYNESVRDLVENKHFTLVELKDRIRNEIALKQNELNESKSLEKASKEAERLVIESRVAREMPDMNIDVKNRGARLYYIDAHGKLVYKTRQGVEIYDFEKYSTNVLRDATAFTYDVHGDRLLVIDKHLQLHSHNFQTSEVQHIGRIEMGIDPSRLKMELSPGGKKFALYLEDTIEIFDAQTGKFLKKSDSQFGTTLGLSIQNAKFINENEVLYSGGQRLFKLNITTGEREVAFSLASQIGNWEITADRKFAIVESKQDILIVGLDSDKRDGHLKYFKNEKINRGFIFVDGVQKPLVFVRNEERLGFYKVNNMNESVFNFEGSFTIDSDSSRKFINMAVSENGKKAVVVFEDSLDKKVYSEVWSFDLSK